MDKIMSSEEFKRLEDVEKEFMGLMEEYKRRAVKCFDVVDSDKKPKILYICDRRACEKCNLNCCLTADVSHARNFERSLNGNMREVNYTYDK